MKKTPYILFSALLLLTALASADEQVYIEGFPDVPLLTELSEQAADRVVFDAPSGTVAETVIRGKIPAKDIINAYAQELIPFGWDCIRQPMTLTCVREKNRLVFLNDNPAEKSGLIILRLEPIE